MAKVKFSALISEMRNKLNGSVFARNRGGAYLRTKVTPSNPQSIAQVLVRARLAAYAQAWRSLTEEQRTAWSAAVGSWQTTDVFGDLLNPTGNTLYTRLNINIAIADGAALVLPPTPVGVASMTALSVVGDDSANTVIVTATPSDVPANTAMVIEATPQMSPGISNANSKFRQVEVFAPAAAGPFDISASYQAKFGTLVTGQKLFVRVKYINQLTGERSQPLNAYSIVVA